MNLIQESVDRVERFLHSYETDQPAEILADIMHYCKAKGFDLAEQLNIAEDYMFEELSFMEEVE